MGGTLETLLHRNFQNFLWGSNPRLPFCITIYTMSFWYPPLLLKGWEDNDPNIYRQVGEGCDFSRIEKGVLYFFFFFLKTWVQDSHPLLVINDRSHFLKGDWQIRRMNTSNISVPPPYENCAKIGTPNPDRNSASKRAILYMDKEIFLLWSRFGPSPFFCEGFSMFNPIELLAGMTKILTGTGIWEKN